MAEAQATASTKARPRTAEELVAEVKAALGDSWPPRIYAERVMPLRTRAHELPEARGPVEVLHTLLGVELKVGRRRLSCPDLATARYLAVFARAGCGRVAVPYDITKISPLADELESGWHRGLLLAGHLSEGRGEAFRSRVRRALVAEMRREITESGAGDARPQFNQNTRQRGKRI